MKFAGDPGSSTIAEAKTWLREQTKDAKKSAECPCCTQDVRIWPRKLNSGMARAAIIFYRAGQPGEWINVSDLPSKQKLELHHLEYAKLRFWGLLEEQKDPTLPKSKSQSLWRLTALGRKFVTNEVRVPRKVWVYDNEVIGRQDPETTSILEALGDDFDFDSLMSGKG